MIFTVIVRHLSQVTLLAAFLNISGCSSTTTNLLRHVALTKSGQCTALHNIGNNLCLEIDEAVDGDVKTTLFVEGFVSPLIETTTYLTPAYVITSPSGKYIALVETGEGHPVFAFYETKGLLDRRSEVAPLMVLNDTNLAHIEFLKDNGDVAYALTEGTFISCQTYEVEFIEGSPRHTERCLIGVNIKTKKTLSFQLPYQCNL